MDENTNNAQFDAGAAVDNLLMEQPVVEETQEQAEEPSPEEARKAEINEGISTLVEDGWTPEEILAFSQDAGAQEDIQKNGKTVRQAARAYERRLRQAEKAAEQKPAAKRGVPTVKTASGNGAGGRDQIAEMSDKEFDAFYKQAMADALSGKKRRL